MTIASDDAAVQSKVTDFINAYNSMAKQMATLRSYDATNRKAGPLLGDALLRNVESQLRKIITDPVAGTSSTYSNLSSIGVSFGSDGTLALDATKFEKVMTADPVAVGKVFSGTTGAAGKLDTFITAQLAAKGSFDSRDQSITAQRKDLTRQQDALNVRMAAFQTRYQTQFTALDSMLSQMQSTSSYLTQQLDQSTKIAKSAGS